MAKIYYVKKTHHDRVTAFSGTMEELVNGTFGYTLECGHSWNNKIKRYPKTGKSLVNALNDSAYETHRYFDWYDLITEEEYLKIEGR